jgi:hypothetical protein
VPGSNFFQTMTRKYHEENRMPEPIPDLAPDLAAILAKLQAQNPEERFQTPDELVSSLEALLARARGPAGTAKQNPKRNRRWIFAALALTAVLLASAAIAFRTWRNNREITVSTDDPDVEVITKPTGAVVRVADRKTGQTWALDPATRAVPADAPEGLRFEAPDGSVVVINKNGAKGKPAFTVTRGVKLTGRLQPVETARLYPAREGQVREVRVKPGDRIDPGFECANLFSRELEDEYGRVARDLAEANAQVTVAREDLNKPNLRDEDKLRTLTDKRTAESRVEKALQDIRTMDLRYNNGKPNRPGYFRVVAPPFDARLSRAASAPSWTVLNDERRESPVGRTLRPGEEVLRVGNLGGAWHAESELPQLHVGRVLKAFADPGAHAVLDDAVRGKRKYLVAEVRLSSQPETAYEGRLYRDQIAAEVVADTGAPNVPAYVSLDASDIPQEKRVPRDQLVVGLEVHTFLFGRPEPPSNP